MKKIHTMKFVVKFLYIENKFQGKSDQMIEVTTFDMTMIV